MYDLLSPEWLFRTRELPSVCARIVIGGKVPTGVIYKFCFGPISLNWVGGFQSSALPTELPGHGMRKRVLNSCERSESSPERRFRASGPIIPGSRRAGFVEGDVEVPGNDAGEDAGGLGKRPITDPQQVSTVRCDRLAVTQADRSIISPSGYH